MDARDGLGPNLAALESALGQRRLELLEQIRQIDRDLEAVKVTRAAGQRLGFGSNTSSAAQPTSPAQSVVPFRSSKPSVPSPTYKKTTFPDAVRQEVSDTDLASVLAKELGPARNDRVIPPAVDKDGVRPGVHDAPNKGRALQAVREDVQEIAKRAVQAGPGAGGRRTLSAKGLVHGEPPAPSIRNVLAAADRPLTTHQVAVAVLEARNLRYEGAQMTAVTSRMSALLAQDRKKKKVLSSEKEGSKERLWVSPCNAHLLPLHKTSSPYVGGTVATPQHGEGLVAASVPAATAADR